MGPTNAGRSPISPRSPAIRRTRRYGLGAGQPVGKPARRRNRGCRRPLQPRPHVAGPPQRHPGAEMRQRLRVERFRPRSCRSRHWHANPRHLRADQPMALGAAQSARGGNRNFDGRPADVPSRPAGYSSSLHDRHPGRKCCRRSAPSQRGLLPACSCRQPLPFPRSQRRHQPRRAVSARSNASAGCRAGSRLPRPVSCTMPSQAGIAWIVHQDVGKAAPDGASYSPAPGSTTRATAHSIPRASSRPIAGTPASASRSPACCST